MKFFSAVVLFTFILSGQNYSQVTGLSNTDPRVFTRYKLPATTVKQFLIDGNAMYSANRSSDPSRMGENSQYNINLNPSYMYLNESDDRIMLFNGYLSSSFSANKDENKHNDLNSRKNSASNLRMAISASPSIRIYASSGSSLFYNLNAELKADISEGNVKQSSSVEPERISKFGYKAQSYIATAGIGWGRLRNVTPVVNAIRFQERLKVLNKINSDLSEDDILALSGQFSRFSDYVALFDRPGKYFYKDLDNVLSSRNISLDDMNLYSAAYLIETVSELRFLRREGFLFGLNLTMNYNNIYNMNESQPNPRRTEIRENLHAGINFNAEYSHQLDLYSQFSVSLNASGSTNVISHPGMRQKYNLSLNPGYSRELTDRFVLNISEYLTYNLTNSLAEDSYLFNHLMLSLRYFIEDNISINAEYGWEFDEITNEYNDLTGQMPSVSKTLRSTHTISLGVTYTLQNSLNLF